MRLAASTVTVPSLDIVKMEDRKRPAVSEQDDATHPAKRQAMAVNGARSHPDADLPWKDEIENYQKDAILRQMREYKKEKRIVESQLADLEKRAAHHDDHIRTTDAWFTQLIDYIRIIANERLPTQDAQSSDQTHIPSSLLFSDNETFKAHLESRAEAIKALLTDLLSRIPVSSPEAVLLQEQLSSALATAKGHVNELQKRTMERDLFAERLEAATQRYLKSEKNLERAKSAAVAKLEQQAQGGSSGADDSGKAKSEHSKAVNGSSDSLRDSADLETAKKSAEATALKLKEHNEQLESENKRLTEELTAKESRLAALSDDDYAKTELFKLFRSQYDDVIKRVNNLEATNNQLREEAQRLQAERVAYRTQIEDENRTAISDLEAQLSRADADLIRIRDSRDKLTTENAIHKARQDDRTVSATQGEELLAAREGRIAALEAQLERLHIQMGEQKVVADHLAELDGLAVDELRTRFGNLQKEYALLNNELGSMELAWRKAQGLAGKKLTDLTAMEEQLGRLSADKAKADQKYFAAMKARDAREVENRSLRTQNKKSAEIIAQLKDSASGSVAVVANLEKQLAETKELMHNFNFQHKTLVQDSSKATMAANVLDTQVHDLKKLLHTRDLTSLEAKKAQKEAEIKVEELKVKMEAVQGQAETWKQQSLHSQSDTEQNLRRMLLCSVCKSRWRNTTVKSCGHVFCTECIEERLTSRSRKCPTCSKSFGASDLLKVHF